MWCTTVPTHCAHPLTFFLLPFLPPGGGDRPAHTRCALPAPLNLHCTLHHCTCPHHLHLHAHAPDGGVGGDRSQTGRACTARRMYAPYFLGTNNLHTAMFSLYLSLCKELHTTRQTMHTCLPAHHLPPASLYVSPCCIFLLCDYWWVLHCIWEDIAMHLHTHTWSHIPSDHTESGGGGGVVETVATHHTQTTVAGRLPLTPIVFP